MTLERFRSSGAGIDIECPACDGRYFVPAPAPDAGATAAPEAVSETAPEPEPEVAAAAGAEALSAAPGDGGAGSVNEPDRHMCCPKCETSQAAGASCRRCGLLAERFAMFAGEGAAGTADAGLRAAWAECVARWDEPSVHDAFAERVVATEAYAFAARNYRAAARARPDDEIAAERLARVRRMAEAAVLSAGPRNRRARGERQPLRGAAWVLVVCVFLAIAGVVYATVQDGAGPGRDRPQPPGAAGPDQPIEPPPP